MMRTTLLPFLAGIVAAAACGEAPPPPPPPRPPAPVEVERDDGVSVESGGSLSRDEVREAFRGVSPRLVECYQRGLARVPHAEGTVTFHVRVSREGDVLWAFTPSSDLGQHDVQECMLAAVRGTRFARPRGGEAEAEFPVDLAPPDAARAPVLWGPGDAAEAVGAARSGIVACLGGATGFSLTLYVAAGGVVVDSGATPPDPEHQDGADCLVRASRDWAFPDPGPDGAKVVLTF